MVRGVDADWQFTERRRAIRCKCRHKVDLLQGPEENKSVAYVLNYSLGGVRLGNPGNIKVGEKVKLRFPHPLPGYPVKSLECEVLWRRKNTKSLEMLAGLKFLEPKERMMSSWIAYFFAERKATTSDLKEDRKSVRVACKLEVIARSEEDRAVGEAVNIGLGGALIIINRPSEIGDELSLDIGGLSSFPAMHFKGRVESNSVTDTGMYAQRVKFVERDDEMLKLLGKYMLALSKDFWD